MSFVFGELLVSERLREETGVHVRKNTDQDVNNSATLQDDDELWWYVEASTVYALRMGIAYDATTVADFKVGWKVPAVASLSWHATGLDTALAYLNLSNANAGSVQAFGGAGAGTGRLIEIYATITVGAVAGNVTLRWAQNTAEVSETFVRAGSYGTLRRIG